MQIERLIQMIFLLIQRQYTTSQELADYFNVSKRTILRDIDTLTLANIPIYTVKGRNGGIGILEEYSIDRTVISKEEQDKIMHSLQVLQATNIPNIEQLLNKLGGLFQVDSKPNWIEVDFSFFGSEEQEKIKFSNMEEAIVGKHVISFEYYTSELQHNYRQVEPLRLLFRSQAWYIQGYCRYKKGIRMFRVSRMRNLKITDERFNRELTEEISLEPDYSLSYELEEFVLKFSPEISHRIYDEYNEKYVQILEDGSFIVRYWYASNEWVIRHILSFGIYVEVLEPLHIRDKVRKRAQEIVEKYK
ncbi:MAG: helix-turn-helix transcriptional regulator [Coprobacillaceae bacterium]